MALNYNGKICRNLQEQVWENVKDIEDLKDDFDTLTSGSMVSGLVLKDVVASVEDLDDIENPVKNGLYMVEPNKLYVYDGVEFVYETEFGKGDKGDQGEQGPTGEQGPQGVQGPQGIQGPIGPQGPKGDSGTSFVITGEVDSESDLPNVSSLDLGTAYFVGTVNPKDVYVVVMVEGVKTWSNEGALQGPVGPQGPQGVQGIQGIQGERGIQGEQGIQGPAGADGQDGTDGVNGTDGITPHIDSTTGNWFIGNTDTGVHAQGPAGQNGQDGAPGADGLTTRISVNGSTYTQVNGLITLPNYPSPSGTSYGLARWSIFVSLPSSSDKLQFEVLGRVPSSTTGTTVQWNWTNFKTSFLNHVGYQRGLTSAYLPSGEEWMTPFAGIGKITFDSTQVTCSVTCQFEDDTLYVYSGSQVKTYNMALLTTTGAFTARREVLTDVD